MLKFNDKFFGFSLIEALVAVAVLLIGILAVSVAFPLSLKVSQSAEQATIAANLAQAKIEEIFQSGYDNLNIGDIEAKHRLAETSADPFYYYQRETEVEYIDSNLNHSETETGMKKITVTVYWYSSALNAEKNMSLTIIMSRK
ncbi:MAG: prepilin-type N-terminal cleavage/methylation domain-containing protein [Patescibacteria group bacterium]